MAEQINVPIPQALYQRIRELARMRKQPVDNVLAEVLDQALPPGNEPDNTAEDTAVEREMQAYLRPYILQLQSIVWTDTYPNYPKLRAADAIDEIYGSG